MSWRDQAACATSDLRPEAWTERFGPQWTGNPVGKAAIRVCQRCPVKADCLADALAWEPADHRWGIWGGTTPYDRHVMSGRKPGMKKRVSA